MVAFNNEWYRETCIENNLNPDNELSKTAIDLARDRAIDMKMYMDAKDNYEGAKLQEKLDREIERLDNERVGHMLDALFYAETMAGIGDSFDTFIKRHFEKKGRLMQDVHVSSSSLTPVEQRVSDRWEQATQNMKG